MFGGKSASTDGFWPSWQGVTLAHHLFEVAVADAVFAIPADADQNDVGRETAAFEVGHGGNPGEGTPVSPPPADDQCNRAVETASQLRIDLIDGDGLGHVG